MTKMFSVRWFSYLPNKIKSFFALILFFKEIKKIKNSEILFFFPSYHTGGAERVHLDIVNSFKERSTYIFFTAKSESNTHKKEFTQSSNHYEIFELLNRTKFTKSLFLKILKKTINNSESILTIFASYSSFFYELIPELKKDIKKIDLTHSFSLSGRGIEVTSLFAVPYISNRVVINKRTLLDFKELYKKSALTDYFKKIQIIQNGVVLKENNYPVKDKNEINICFIGRWSPEKRPELFLRIAKTITEISPIFKTYFIGNNNIVNEKTIKSHCVESLGEIINKDKLMNLYKKFHYIFITSNREGFPMVLMEAMSFGVVPICTNVGGISEHIVHGENGYLVKNHNNEDAIIKDFLEIIRSKDFHINYKKISLNAYNYANENFGIDGFKKSYRNLILQNL